MDFNELTKGHDAEDLGSQKPGTEFGPMDKELAIDDDIGKLQASIAKESGAVGDKVDEVSESAPGKLWLVGFKSRFDSVPQLCPGVHWADVERSLLADTESMEKLQALDAKGHKMNVFGEEDGSFIFVSSWDDYNEVAADHRNIAYDAEGEILARQYLFHPHGNAVDIAKANGVEVADPKFHNQLIGTTKVNGWAWLKTDDTLVKDGCAIGGDGSRIFSYQVTGHDPDGSFRALLRVKKI